MQEEEIARQRAAARQVEQAARLKEALALLQSSGKAEEMRHQVGYLSLPGRKRWISPLAFIKTATIARHCMLLPLLPLLHVLAVVLRTNLH